MLNVQDLRVGNILALMGEEFIAPSPIVAIDETGLIHLDGFEYPESIENMAGVPIPSDFFIGKEALIGQMRMLGLVISPFRSSAISDSTVQVGFNGTFIKDCSFIHELQNIMLDLVGIDPFAGQA